jgi:hypothetical protein
MNKIRRSDTFGIHILTKNGLRADASIKFNWIEKNIEDGIVLEGD